MMHHEIGACDRRRVPCKRLWHEIDWAWWVCGSSWAFTRMEERRGRGKRSRQGELKMGGAWSPPGVAPLLLGGHLGVCDLPGVRPGFGDKSSRVCQHLRLLGGLLGPKLTRAPGHGGG